MVVAYLNPIVCYLLEKRNTFACDNLDLSSKKDLAATCRIPQSYVSTPSVKFSEILIPPSVVYFLSRCVLKAKS